ncbi:MAG: 2'-5' RNA ligase family protein [Nocardioidaceae bacterium]|nr:2'-5' RNA ligase family protein [Nocardioidaceae bacterium]MCL2612460.1 2'-5' RNA ligase family protein [Nocardioidaceae bacterium]
MSSFRTAPPTADDGTATIGVAIAIPEPWATELQEYRLRIGDPTALGVPTHITLIPPTVVDRELGPIVEHLAGAAADTEPFRVHLRGTGTFRPVSPVVFIGLAEGISQCEALAGAVRRGPLSVDIEFPYHPHVTVAHQMSDGDLDRAFDDLADFDCSFEVRGFHLYVHRGAAGWVPVETFTL